MSIGEIRHSDIIMINTRGYLEFLYYCSIGGEENFWLQAMIIHHCGIIEFVKVGSRIKSHIFSISNWLEMKKVNSYLTDSDGSNNVRSSMFDRSKPKIGCLSSIINK